MRLSALVRWAAALPALLIALAAQAQQSCPLPLTTPDGGTVAEIVPELGGIVSSLRLAESGGAPREILYRHPWFWSRETDELRGGIPPLFPICGRLLRDGDWVDVGPGSVAYIPPDAEHSIENTGGEPLLLICLVPDFAPEL